MPYFKTREEVVQYVNKMLDNSKAGSQLIMTISLGRSGDYSATAATSSSSAGIVRKRRTSYKRRLSISTEPTQDG